MRKYVSTIIIEVEDADDLEQALRVINNVGELGDYRQGVEVHELNTELVE